MLHDTHLSEYVGYRWMLCTCAYTYYVIDIEIIRNQYRTQQGFYVVVNYTDCLSCSLFLWCSLQDKKRILAEYNLRLGLATHGPLGMLLIFWLGCSF